jgi:hypothetical protein
MLAMMATVPMEMDAAIDARSKEDSSARVVLTQLMIFAKKSVVTDTICLTQIMIVMMETLTMVMVVPVFALLRMDGTAMEELLI